MRKSDKWAICVISLALVACGGDRSPAGQNDPDPSGSQTLSKLAAATVVESGGLVGEEFVIELENAGDNTLASLTSTPNGSAAVLTTATPGLRFTFTPDVEGAYAVTFTQGSETRVVQIAARKNLPFDVADLIPGTGATATTGLLASQFVFHTSLDRATVEREFFETYQHLGLVGISGPFVYVQVDRDSDSSVAELENLKASSGYSFFGPRRIMDIPTSDFEPDDGRRFDDSGNNWHLEKIHAPQAWDLSRGSVDISIGVMDSYVDTKHEELEASNGMLGRVSRKKNLKTEDDPHGTAVTSVIVGREGNGKGVSGINHFSMVSFIAKMPHNSENMYDLYKTACDGNRVVNHSWSAYKVKRSKNPVTGEEFLGANDDEWISGRVSERINSAISNYPTEMFWSYYEYTQNTRAFAKQLATPSCLMVLSAGNDGMDAKFANGSIHYESSRLQSSRVEHVPVSNVIVVAALRRNGRLADNSNFGESVELAAPTEFMAAKSSGLIQDEYFGAFNTEEYGAGGGFGGTSAAAPVVTGVASLIISKYPQFDAATVKRILIDSASEKVIYRDLPCKKAGECGRGLLPQPIPIIDAEAALKLAAKIAVPPTVYFSTSLVSPKVGDVIRFTPTVLAANGQKISSYQWSFGDGHASTSSVLSAVEHSFANPGTYTVQLYVVDDAGVSNLSSTRVTVQPKPVVTTPSLSINFGPGSRTLLGAENFQAVDFISGREGRYAAKFGGISNPGYIRIPNQAAMQFTDGATFDLWARLDSLTGMDGYGRTVSNGAYAMTLLAKSHDRYGVSFMVNSMTQTSSAWIASFDPSMNGGCERVEHPVVPLGVWRRITYVLSSTTGTQVYVNKRLAYQCPSARPDFTQMNSRDLYIGKFSDVWYPLDGAIQDIRIYKSALSAEQVAALN